MISVCLASYNGEQFIHEQLISILSQLSDDDEVILSDDNSTDNTLQIVEELNDKRIRVYINEGKRGYTSNFENALTKAQGDVIFLSDQDDVWIEGKVEKVLERLKYSDFVVTDAAIVNESLDLINPSHFKLYNVEQGFWINLLKTRYIGACMAFNRKLLTRALPFPKNKNMCAHDYWLACIGELYFKVDLIHEPLLKYRRHQSNALSGGVISTNSLGKKILTRLYVLMNLLFR